MMEKENEMLADLGIGTLAEDPGSPETRRYICKGCGPFWFKESIVGDVPSRCGICFRYDFEKKESLKSIEGNKTKWNTNVFDGWLLNARATREWD